MKTLEEKKQFVRENLHKQCMFDDLQSQDWHGPRALVGISVQGRFIDLVDIHWDDCKLYEEPKTRESLVKQVDEVGVLYRPKDIHILKQMAKELDALAEKSDD